MKVAVQTPARDADAAGKTAEGKAGAKGRHSAAKAFDLVYGEAAREAAEIRETRRGDGASAAGKTGKSGKAEAKEPIDLAAAAEAETSETDADRSDASEEGSDAARSSLTSANRLADLLSGQTAIPVAPAATGTGSADGAVPEQGSKMVATADTSKTVAVTDTSDASSMQMPSDSAAMPEMGSTDSLDILSALTATPAKAGDDAARADGPAPKLRVDVVHMETHFEPNEDQGVVLENATTRRADALFGTSHSEDAAPASDAELPLHGNEAPAVGGDEPNPSGDAPKSRFAVDGQPSRVADVAKAQKDDPRSSRASARGEALQRQAMTQDTPRAATRSTPQPAGTTVPPAATVGPPASAGEITEAAAGATVAPQGNAAADLLADLGASSATTAPEQPKDNKPAAVSRPGFSPATTFERVLAAAKTPSADRAATPNAAASTSTGAASLHQEERAQPAAEMRQPVASASAGIQASAAAKGALNPATVAASAAARAGTRQSGDVSTSRQRSPADTSDVKAAMAGAEGASATPRGADSVDAVAVKGDAGIRNRRAGSGAAAADAARVTAASNDDASPRSRASEPTEAARVIDVSVGSELPNAQSMTGQVAGKIISAMAPLAGSARSHEANTAGAFRLKAGGAAMKTMQIQLHPADLGTLDVSMRLVDGQLTVELAASEVGTAEKLSGDRDGLKSLLEKAGFTLDEAAITIVAREPSTFRTANGLQDGARQDPSGGSDGRGGSAQSDGSGSRQQSGSGERNYRQARGEPAAQTGRGNASNFV
ncbi:flagellar hook-length control protein FliK [Mangrovicella endophytica]|uniref:flagellar hook-length control protein FliK n=1 Tax=Mangrovicella endophytica TaxID=2066697 RepID=UPI000C9DB1D6|nr:flagellar hook-length control protein FliK [Mangrovicella endophytica]